MAVRFYVFSTFYGTGKIATTHWLSNEGGFWHEYRTVEDGGTDTVRPDDLPSFQLFGNKEEISNLSDAPLVVEVDFPPGLGSMTLPELIFIAQLLDREIPPEEWERVGGGDTDNEAKIAGESITRSREIITKAAVKAAKRKRVPGASQVLGEIEAAEAEAAEAINGEATRDGGRGGDSDTRSDIERREEESGRGGSTLRRALPWIGTAALLTGLTWALVKK